MHVPSLTRLESKASLLLRTWSAALGGVFLVGVVSLLHPRMKGESGETFGFAGCSGGKRAFIHKPVRKFGYPACSG